MKGVRSYSWERVPNISLLDKRVVWWNEERVAIKKVEVR